MAETVRFSGRVLTGRGEAQRFTRLDWVRDRFVAALGIDPHPGTLNLIIDTEDGRDAWTALRSRPGVRIGPPPPGYCSARCYAVRLNDRLLAAIVVPEVEGYPAEQVELVAAVPIRQTLAVTDGDRVEIGSCGPLAVRALIFDVDGTLVDSLPAYRIVAERAAAPYGIAIADEAIREALNTTRAFWEIAVPDDYADRAVTIAALAQEAARLWPEVLRTHGRVFPGVERVLRALRARDVTLGIVTGSRRGSLDTLRAEGLLNLFDAVVTGEEVTRRKPDPEGLVACLRTLQVGPREAAYVGDTPLDVEAARRAGIFSIGMLTGAANSAVLTASGADRVAASHERLLDPAVIVHLTRPA